MSIAVIDYGAGNLASVCKALRAVGASAHVTSRPTDIASATAIVIPGVGHFRATRAIDDGARSAMLAAIDRGVPVLGICLGMQWLFEGSVESPDTPGLGVFAGVCTALSGDVKVPHVGWNSLERTAAASVLLNGVADGSAAYFTHSYAAPVTSAARATTTHGAAFGSVVEGSGVFGTQWHPEKSGEVGLAVLRNFVALRRGTSC